MELVISHLSALRYWRRFGGNLRYLERQHLAEAMTHPARMNADLLAELAGLGFLATKDNPLDLLFYRNAVRSAAVGVRSHATSRQLPRDSLVRLSEHVLIAAPELAFVQVAESYPFEQLVMAGCELCGGYRLFGDDGTALALPEERPRLTSTERIDAALRELGLGPRTKAAQAARYVFDNARSPMEAKVALLLCMPARRGGYGLPRPVLNPDVRLSREAQALYPCSVCHPDLYWTSARLDVEYDGADTHTAEAHAKDVARAAAFACEGIEMLVVAKAQVYDREAFEAVAAVIAKRLHRRLPERKAAFDGAHTRIRRELGL
ncbi:MAG: hypothetical protein IKD70_03995 [Eggerthellaceae bacterium]|nr:hypothetical protein [Eggerthellaceae bacterium]